MTRHAGTGDELNGLNRLYRVPGATMTDEHNSETATETEIGDHLREALRHLDAAQEGDLRKTNAVALEEVSQTITSVLREYEQDGHPGRSDDGGE
ncbi:hypothetical protein C484_21162 [Natrialba taiwanensis DSM 12281]|uniref:Uncharacterized protein n=2 Tax=Natrialba taiwanensis TaxID=160846 RepID=L9ZFK6_9EURY|nr:hypothetical protein C484_21162 [Natrialba taiwanensis DSM 12281]